MKVYATTAGIALCLLCVSLPAWSGIVSKSDENRDGKIDQWIEDIGDKRFRVHSDLNYDGNVDYSMVYRDDGQKELEELDFNYDGVMDDFYIYVAGVLDRREVDTNYDGEIDLWVYLKEGVYIGKVERDTDFDGEIDYVKVYGASDAGEK